MSSSGFYIFPDFGNIRKELQNRGIETGEQMCSAIMEEVGVAVRRYEQTVIFYDPVLGI